MQITHIQAEILTQVCTDVEQRFAAVDDLAHGWEHVHRVYELALSIGERERANRFIVGMAALMHDLGRAAGKEKTAHHADVSVLLARELLTKYEVPGNVQEEILHAIIAHSFSRGIEPLTIEARVVRDADRLDGLGAIGILRWAITGTLRRSAQTRSYHPEDPFAEQHPPDDSLYLLDHFYTKLLKLGDSMATETGRVLAHRRVAFMHEYLDELKRELQR